MGCQMVVVNSGHYVTLTTSLQVSEICQWRVAHTLAKTICRYLGLHHVPFSYDANQRSITFGVIVAVHTRNTWNQAKFQTQC